MNLIIHGRPIKVLLFENNLTGATLTEVALKHAKMRESGPVAKDGVGAPTLLRLANSQAQENGANDYGPHANRDIREPLNFERSLKVGRATGDFWFKAVMEPAEVNDG